MKNSKFLPLYETIYTRFKQGAGFLQGDVVKLADGYKNTESYKSLAENIKQLLEDISKSGYNIRVSRLHTPNNQYGSYGHLNLPATHADIFQEKTPGNIGNLVTVPLEFLETVDTGVNLPSVPKEMKRDAKEDAFQHPSEWESNKDEPETKEQNHLGHEQNWAKKGDYKLATKNSGKMPGANKYDDTKPSKFKPLKKSVGTKVARESVEALEEAYIAVHTEDTSELSSVTSEDKNGGRQLILQKNMAGPDEEEDEDDVNELARFLDAAAQHNKEIVTAKHAGLAQ